jgi:predicted phosphodiesterase
LTRLVEKLIQERPEFVVIPGDLVMANGADSAPWNAFLGCIQPLVETGIPIHAVPGNHDLDGDVLAARREWSKRLGLQSPGIFYSFNARNAHFIGLCTPPATHGVLHEKFNLPEGEMTQLEWFARDLECTREAPWRFVFHHEPGTEFCRLSEPKDGAGSAAVSEFVEPLAWREGVDLVFRGHQHLYERTYPLNPLSHARDDERGISLITVGGGCVAYRPEDPQNAVPHWFDAAISLHQMHYLKIRLRGHVLTAEAKNLDGEVFDQFSIRKKSDGSRKWEGLPTKGIFLVKNRLQPY